MDLKALRYFTEIVRHGSLRKAGDKLHITQPALSRYIQGLEEELGVDLFVRNARGVSPTDAAQTLASGARKLLEDVDRLKAEVKSHASIPGGTLRIGVLPAFGRHFAARVIAKMRGEHPSLRFVLVEAFSEKLRSMVLAGELDAAVIASLEKHPDLQIEPLYEEQIWLIGSRKNWRPESRHLDIKSLANVPVVASGFVKSLVRRTAPQIDLRCVVEIDGASVMPDLLRQNIGLYLGPPTMLWAELQSKEFVGAPVDGLSFLREMIWRKDRPKSAGIEVLLASSKESLETFKSTWQSGVLK